VKGDYVAGYRNHNFYPSVVYYTTKEIQNKVIIFNNDFTTGDL